MKCLSCNKNKARNVPPYGLLPCLTCTKKQQQYIKPNPTIEMVDVNTTDDRKRFSKDIVQPFREGVLSKEYLREYGTKTIKVTEDDIKNAKEVWGENQYYKGEG